MTPFYLRNFLRLCDFNLKDISLLINNAKILKFKKLINKEKKLLKKKNIVLIFEKESTRTRCSFEVAAFDQGAKTTYLGNKNTHIGYKESIEDTAETLGKLYDGILYRGNSHKIIEKLAKYSKIPVWNGLTNYFHPTQIVSDLLTIQEIFYNKPIKKIKIAYIGDAKNNISNSLIEASNLFKFRLNLISNKKYLPKKKFFKKYNININKNKKNIFMTENIEIGIKNVDLIYTDVWISMGEKIEKQEQKINLLKNYQVNEEILKLTNNPFIKVFHCLPALHNKKTTFGKKIIKKFNLKNGVEITNKVFKINKKIIFQQSENRLHIVKSLLINTLLKNFSI
ncbi:MAG: ornithine carbamoyltransferase [Buchnera aphidicola (Periphyllus lyropictus)]|uniref:ornithine carbamoyltransferase n=1 Tax=Buchnera aphidicola TaxID=9 RepID=UPI001EB18A8C|nr:ornithine carbamoyltransferase [Buchnera aphidicola]NIH16582.1 ornithine carbamoyltransferase [Buchnera aphidicola (Periphyllus lyropictus)]USS94472.1 ornithine carbamoyltransferase [Buchnera aphidicola (Periphyllus lyropictus)]